MRDEPVLPLNANIPAPPLTAQEAPDNLDCAIPRSNNACRLNWQNAEDPNWASPRPAPMSSTTNMLHCARSRRQ